MSSLFKFQRITDNIIRINDLCGLTNEFFYFVIGEERAAFIDAGYGIGDLRAIATHFTNLPVIVINTHGHLDHVGGDYCFDSVYINPDDNDLLLSAFNPDLVEKMVNEKLDKAGITTCDSMYIPKNHELKLLPIYDGDKFDLGNVTLEAIAMPGHSKGSVSFLYKEERILFSGDNCGPQPLIMLPYNMNLDNGFSSAPLHIYYDSLLKLHSRIAEFNRILNCHKSGELPISCFLGVEEAVGGVLSGKYSGVPVSVLQGKISGVYSVRGLDPEKVGKLPNSYIGDVVFSKDNL